MVNRVDVECREMLNPDCAREFGEINARLDNQHNEIVEIKESLHRIEKILVGNGEPGITGRVTTLEECANSNRRWIYIILTFVGTAAAVIAAILALPHFVKGV